MNRPVVFLTVLVVVLSGALMFLIGRDMGREAAKAPEAGPAVSLHKPLPAASRPIDANSTNRPKMSKAQGSAGRPVQIGLDGPQFDACGSNGRVVGLNPNGDNFLAVKSSPSLSARRTDKLGPGQEVHVCDTVGEWHSIVYEPSGGPSARCGVTSPVEAPRAYSGPCQSGWVFAKYIDIYAG